MDKFGEIINKISSFNGESEEEIESFLCSAEISETLQQLAEDVFLRSKDQDFSAFQSIITKVKEKESLWAKYIELSGDIISSAIDKAPNPFRTANMVQFLYNIAPDIIGTDHFADLLTKHFNLDIIEQNIENAFLDDEKHNLIVGSKIFELFILEFRTQLKDEAFIGIINTFSEILAPQYPVLYSWFLIAFLDEIDVQFKKEKNWHHAFFFLEILDVVMEKMETRQDQRVSNRLSEILNDAIDLDALVSKLAACRDRVERSKIILQEKLGSIVASRLTKKIDDFGKNQYHFPYYSFVNFMANLLKNEAYNGVREALQQVIMQQAAKKADSGKYPGVKNLEVAESISKVLDSIKDDEVIEVLKKMVRDHTRDDFFLWEETSFLDLFLENDYYAEGVSIVLARVPKFKANPDFSFHLLKKLLEHGLHKDVVMNVYSMDDLAAIGKALLKDNRRERATQILLILSDFFNDREFIDILLAIGNFEFGQDVIHCIESRQDDTGRMIDLLGEYSRGWVEREKTMLPLKIAEATKELQKRYDELLESVKDSYMRLKIDSLPYLLDVEWVRLKREIEEFRLHMDLKQFKIEHVWNHVELSLSILLFFIIAIKMKENTMSVEDMKMLRDGLAKYDFTMKIILVKHFMKRGKHGLFSDVKSFINEQEKFLNAKEKTVPDATLVDIRNTGSHKVFIAPPISHGELEALLANIEAYHTKLDFLKEVKMLYKTGNQRWVKSDIYISLSGPSHVFPIETGNKTDARENAVYLSTEGGLVGLEPFFFMVECKNCNAQKVFILNRYDEKKPPVYIDDENHPIGEDILERISEILKGFFTRLQV